MEPEIVKLEPNNRVSMSMSLYERIKSIAFCKECGCVIGACDCAGLAAFALDEKYYLLDLFDRRAEREWECKFPLCGKRVVDARKRVYCDEHSK